MLKMLIYLVVLFFITIFAQLNDNIKVRYAGSKRKFMKELLPILLEGADDDTVFIDAFGGGMNVVCGIPLKRKFAIEINRYVFALWNNIKNYGLSSLNLPENSDELTQEMYDDIKLSYLNNDGRYPDYLIGFIGSCCSYGGAWMNGYAKFNVKKNEDHIKEAYNGLKKQVDSFKNLESTLFLCNSYKSLGDDIYVPGNCVIYCDPPYLDTKKYESDFDHFAFWDWVRLTSRRGIKVYVSEYTAPDDFKCIWSAKKYDGMGTTKTGKKQTVKTEKLFVYNG